MASVLLVDDAIAFGRALARRFPTFTFVQAPTLREGRERIPAGPFARYLLDVGLPDGCGLDLVDAIVARDPAARICIVTADPAPSESVKAACLRHGFALWCKGPIEPLGRFLGDPEAASRASGVQRSITRTLAVYAARHGLTPREIDVVREAMLGHDPCAIAERLDIAKRTYEAHAGSILAKTRCKKLPAVAIEVWNLHEGPASRHGSNSE